MVRKVTGTCGQSASWSDVGSGAPNPWFASTISAVIAMGASSASRYHLGAARQVLRLRPQDRSSARPWHDTTMSAAKTGPSGRFSAPEPPVRKSTM